MDEGGLYFQTDDGLVRIYRDDCVRFLKRLPDESVDVIVTDPAYSGMNQKMKFGNGRIVGRYGSKDNPKWFQEFHDTEDNYRLFLGECRRVLKKNSHIYIMFDSFSLLSLAPLLREYFDVKNIIVWDKVTLGMGHYFRRKHEFIVFSTKGKRKLNTRDIPDVWRFKRITKREYPTQKPVELFEMMLKGSVQRNGGSVVCDPFVGSGSSAIAAMRMNCEFVGCDIDEKACQICRNRILNYSVFGVDRFQTKTSRVRDDQ